MSGINVFKQYAGSICLYNTIEQRKPSVFLTRNIRQVLDGHERDLKSYTSRFKGKSGNKNLALPYRSMHNQHATSWSLPPQQMLKDVVEARRPVLRMEPKELKKAGPISPDERKPRPASPEWLPDLDCIRLKAIVTMKICDKGGKRIFLQESKSATLVGFSPASEDYRFAIHMEKPFIVELNKLLIKADSSNETSAQWKKTSCGGPVVSFTISFLNSHDATQVLSNIDPEFALGTSPEGCELRASWQKLPVCPSPSRLHRVYRTSKGSAKPLDFGLDFDMAWTEPKDTPLAATNRAYREVDSQGYSKRPSIMPLVQQDTNTHRITYVYEGGALQARSIVGSGLRCIFCSSSHQSFKRLHFHYLASHDHFSYDIVKESDTGSLVEVKIYVHVADKQYERASNNVSDEREIHWIRPTRPFDLDAYLNGTDMWTAEKAMPRKAGGRAKSPTNQFAAPKAQMVTSKIHVKAPEEIKELPRKMKRKHSIPELKGVTFFRTVSKRRVETGEELSESDDDVDVFWQRMAQGTRSLPNLAGPARDFAALYDEHMHAEDPVGDLYIGDAVLRFTRAHKQQLAHPELYPEYLKKLSQLRESGLVTENMCRHCIGLLRAQRSEGTSLTNGVKGVLESNPGRSKRTLEDVQTGPSSTEPPSKRAKQALEEAPAETSNTESPTKSRKQLTRYSNKNGIPTPATNGILYAADKDLPNGALPPPPSDASDAANTTTLAPQLHPPAPSPSSPPPPRRNGLCICSKSATGRGIILCSNVKCPHNEFHLKCVGLTAQDSSWRCPNCRPTIHNEA